MDRQQEQHRKECEARWVLKHFSDNAERRQHYERIAKKRGKPAANELMQEVKRQHALQSEKRQTVFKQYKRDEQKQQQVLADCMACLT